MSDPPERHADTTPRWVKVFAAVALAVLVVVAVVLLVGSGHGPGRHAAEAVNAALA